MGTIDGLGGLFNFVGITTGKHLSMVGVETMLFVSWAPAGNQVLTVTESIDGASEQNLAVIDQLWKAPGTGGTWTEITQTASHTYTHSDAVNDAVAFTVRADQLSDGYTCVVGSTSTTSLVAVAVGLRFARIPSNLADLITA